MEKFIEISLKISEIILLIMMGFTVFVLTPLYLIEEYIRWRRKDPDYNILEVEYEEDEEETD